MSHCFGKPARRCAMPVVNGVICVCSRLFGGDGFVSVDVFSFGGLAEEPVCFKDQSPNDFRNHAFHFLWVRHEYPLVFREPVC